jgi:hypothetical protein
MVDAIRSQMVVGSTSEHGLLVDGIVLAAGLTVLLLIAARLYPRLAQ